MPHNRDHYHADLRAFESRVKVFALAGQSDNKPGQDERRIEDLIALRDQAEKLLKKWGDR